MVAFRRAKPYRKDAPLGWHVALFALAASAVYAWPAQKEPIIGTNDSVFTLREDVGDVARLAFTDWKGLTGQTFTWRSPAWQKIHWPRCKWASAVRAVAVGKEEALEVLGARFAFWSIDLAALIVLARIFEIALPVGASLLDVILTLVMAILKCTLDEAIDIAKKRVSIEVTEDNLCEEELLDVDEAADCLEKDDVQRVENQKKKLIERKEKVTVYRDDIVHLIRQRREEKEGAKHKDKKPKVEKIPMPATLPMEDTQVAKRCFPPNTLLWKARGTTSWHCRVQNWPELSRSVRKYGESTLSVLASAAWKDHCEIEGLPWPEGCPYTNVLQS